MTKSVNRSKSEAKSGSKSTGKSASKSGSKSTGKSGSKSSAKSGSKSSAKSGSQSRNFADRYDRFKDVREHMLARPDTYIGSTDTERVPMWVYNLAAKEGEALIVKREIEYTPGLLKIFDEILVNARDHVVRCQSDTKAEKCTKIRVNIDEKTGEISVWNNGQGIPVVKSKKHDVLIPCMIFGEFFSSDNFDDTAQRKVGGRNGIGAKAANTFSLKFQLENLDAANGKKFYQCYRDNMSSRSEPRITTTRKKKSYTHITFSPDYARFGLEGLTQDVLALFRKRVHDIAMTTTAQVFYNDELITQNNFSAYVDMYFPSDASHQKAVDVSNEDWHVAVVFDIDDTLEHQCISFVNGICTHKGGYHVDYVSGKIVADIKATIARRNRDLDVKPAAVKENMVLFVDSVIINPTFDSQTKDFLTTPVAKFGSEFEVSRAFSRKITETGIVEKIVDMATMKSEANLLRSGGSKTQGFRHAKYYPASMSNRKTGHECTLILTEGDSAKTFALAGLNIVGRDRYGIFPLRGKLLNVRDASHAKIRDNAEINAVVKIMGLESNRDYTSTKGLFYGSIMVLTDQDLDGFHIKGLIINFIHRFWPSLAKIPGFICYFTTPLLKVTKGFGKREENIYFSDRQSYLKWQAETPQAGWKAKYYKGLATNTPREARDCFKNLDEKIIKFQRAPSRKGRDGRRHHSPCDDAIKLAFVKTKADQRKVWLNTFEPEATVEIEQGMVYYNEFFHKEYLGFSVYDTYRSLPSLVDGLKPSQRKVLFGCFKKGLWKQAIKVSQLAGYIGEKAAYHHGDTSLCDTIIGMGQDFVGSNNLWMLMPDGQFGSRVMGGKDAGSPRYIFTLLNNLDGYIFNKTDAEVLESQEDDGMLVEPKYYVPIVPMLLVNGCRGIGTGYSTNVEPCNMHDIYDNLLRIMDGKKPHRMKPWYRNFTGEVVVGEKCYTRAKYEYLDSDKIHITDLPIGRWTEDYRAFLVKLLEAKGTKSTSTRGKSSGKSSRETTTKAKGKSKAKGGAKAKAGAKGRAQHQKSLKDKAYAKARVNTDNKVANAIKDWIDRSTDTLVDITIIFEAGALQQISEADLEKHLKLRKSFSMTNMHVFNADHKIIKYDSYGGMLRDFAKIRLEIYDRRREHQLAGLLTEIQELDVKARFIQGVIKKEIRLFRKGRGTKMADVIAKLQELDFPLRNDNYNYLLKLPTDIYTYEKVKELRDLMRQRREEYDTLKAKTAMDLWREELEVFMEAYNKWEAETDAEYEAMMEESKANGGSGTKGKRRKQPPRKPRKKTRAATK